MSKSWDDAKRDRETGMSNAASGQEDWMEHAVEFAVAWVTESARYRPYFLAEDIVEKARESNLGAPRDPRAWGPVMRRVEKMGYIVNIGYAPARTSNVSPKVKWAAVEHVRAIAAQANATYEPFFRSAPRSRYR